MPTLIAASLFVALLSWQIRRRYVHRLPTVAGDAFARVVCDRCNISPEEALIERDEVAEAAGFPPEKLSPDLKISDLSAGSWDVSSRIGIGHIADDLRALADRYGVEPPRRMPITISELIRVRVALKRGNRVD